MKKALSLVIALCLLLSLAACTDAKKADIAEKTRVFTDDCGRDVTIPETVSSIVPSSSFSQIVLMAIAPDMFAGLATELYDSSRTVLPDELFELPVFGSLYATADLNVEELALTAPQLIIDVGSAKSSLTDDLDTLEKQTGIPSLFIEATLETMPRAYRTLGELLGRQERGEALAKRCEEILARTENIMQQVGEDKLDCLYIMGDEGLNVLAKGTFHAEVIDLLTNNLAVVDNPMSKGTGNEVTMEQIALWDPEFIIFAPDSIYESVKEKDPFNQMRAIVNGNYIRVPDVPNNWLNMPPSGQRYLGLIWLTAVLYPEYCDYDAESEIRSYFELFYNCTLTDEQYFEITEGAFFAQ